MKICSICKQDKSLESFNKHPKRKDGLQTHCRDCNKQKSKNYYNQNKEKHQKETYKRKKQYIIESQQKILEILSQSKCIDCGETDILTLEFDHKNNKKDNVSSLLKRGNCWKVLETEILKCDIRCSNCHSRKTHKEQNSYRYKFLGCKL
jgi:5-methylcytosine-specific restriction endonuclease McrA